ncbi:ThuA domain-containing protein [Bifidobacterium olomucense]|uniref:Glutamine amidotransferase n=1 Tax=Bifidobacterium olomucense TaxID=2675324 RepID=A0A7Y0HX55_9BIFI|nr:ThuA domain-containing protein [Bifidobacterium sp. DSM 109959]NMM99001.1 glutamine amidotransferase [Bifidobacterium sp. DSM 109959]
MTINVTVWNEYIEEREYPNVRAVYPDGIHEVLAGFLSEEEDLAITTRTLDMADHGLDEATLDATDVLVFWNHMAQDAFTDEEVERVRDHVLRGMGLVTLHSAHWSRIMQRLLGTSMTLSWKHDDRERLVCVNRAHPIAAGVPQFVDIDQEELYGEPFDIPKPDDVVFAGWFAGGNLFPSACTWTRGLGRIFYFQPGHEEYPTYYIPEIQRIITNGVRWAAPTTRQREPIDCVALERTPEEEYAARHQ